MCKFEYLVGKKADKKIPEPLFEPTKFEKLSV